MGMAMTLQDYLSDSRIDFEIVTHPYQATSMSTAGSAGIPGDKLAKGVLLRDAKGYVLAVVPSTHMLDLGRMKLAFGRDFDLASEGEIDALFEDCDPGAVPPIGAAYGMKVVMDDSLTENKDIYFEGGDHRSLVHVSGDAFARLMAAAEHARFSDHV